MTDIEKEAKRPSRKDAGETRAANRPERRSIVNAGPLAPYSRYVTEGFVGRWVADRPDKIERRKMMGYRVVLKPNEDGSGEAPIVVYSGADGARLMLMEIQEEFYLEDQATGQKEVDETEEAIEDAVHRGPDGVPFYDGKLFKE